MAVVRNHRYGIDMTTEYMLQTCIFCGTSETPLWRANTFDRQKNLCNACGVRENRLKRAKREADAELGPQWGRERAGEGSSGFAVTAKRAASVSCLSASLIFADCFLCIPSNRARDLHTCQRHRLASSVSSTRCRPTRHGHWHA